MVPVFLRVKRPSNGSAGFISLPSAGLCATSLQSYGWGGLAVGAAPPPPPEEGGLAVAVGADVLVFWGAEVAVGFSRVAVQAGGSVSVGGASVGGVVAVGWARTASRVAWAATVCTAWVFIKSRSTVAWAGLQPARMTSPASRGLAQSTFR